MSNHDATSPDTPEYCYIFGAAPLKCGVFPPREQDFVIAADGGFNAITSLGIDADIIIGDFDSLGHIPEREGVIKFPTAKDDTDTMLAVTYGMSHGYKRFLIYGGTGGSRPDHTAANIVTLCKIAQNQSVGFLIGEGSVTTAIANGGISFAAGKSGYISAFAAGGSANRVTIRGLKYPLESAELEFGSTLCTSNEFTQGEAMISVDSGTLVVIWYEDLFFPDSVKLLS